LGQLKVVEKELAPVPTANSPSDRCRYRGWLLLPQRHPLDCRRRTIPDSSRQHSPLFCGWRKSQETEPRIARVNEALQLGQSLGGIRRSRSADDHRSPSFGLLGTSRDSHFSDLRPLQYIHNAY